MANSINELKSLIDWLAKDPLNRFEIYDVDKNKIIHKCITYQDLIKDSPDPQEYFVNLAESGVKTVQIVQKRKNGSSFVREGCGLNFAISKNNVVASGSQALPAATQQQLSYSNQFTGLGNPGSGSNPLGLGLPEIMEMKSHSDRYQELRETYVEVKKRNDELEKENRKLENDNLRHQLGVDSKPSAIDKLVEGIANNPSALPQIIASFKGGSTPGLNAPEPHNLLSDTKSTVVDLISNNPQVKDDHVAASYYVLIEALKGNENFLNDYSALLTKYKLIQDGNNISSNG